MIPPRVLFKEGYSVGVITNINLVFLLQKVRERKFP